MSNMKELVEYISQSVVNEPNQVEVIEKSSRRSITYRLTVAPDDMGRVIGKQGRMANAMRTLLRVAAIKSGKNVTLEIRE